MTQSPTQRQFSPRGEAWLRARAADRRQYGLTVVPTRRAQPAHQAQGRIVDGGTNPGNVEGADR